MAGRKQRPRRSQEEARAHILDAADVVFRDHLPDAVGLREIAAEADVSHGLVTHYFQTYDGLVEAVIQRRVEHAHNQAFQRLARATFLDDETPLMSALVDLLADRTLTRLIAWAFLNGRGAALIKQGSVPPFVELLGSRIERLWKIPVDRTRLQLGCMIVVAAVMGFGVLGAPIDGMFEREKTTTREELCQELHRMLRLYVSSTP